MKRLMYSIIASVGLMTVLGMTAHADEQATNEGNVPLSVKANLPENQLEGIDGYFSLLVKPGDKQELSVTLRNSGKTDVDVRLSVTTATTNQTGSIEYSQDYDKKTKDTSLKFPMSELLTPKKEVVTVPANKEVTTTVALSVPAERFEGMLLGAIKIDVEEKKDEPKEDKGAGVSIKNKYAYSIGVKLTEEEKTDLKNDLDFLGAEASQITGRNTVFARLQHPNPTIVEEVSYEGQIYKKNSQTALHENRAEGYRIAPNSTYEFPISWENTRFEAGEYRLKLLVTSKATGEKWEFDEAFTISRDEAKKLNEKAVDLAPDYTRWILLGIGLFIGLILLLILIIVLVRRRNKKNRKKKRSNSSKKKSTHSSKGKRKR